MAQPEKQPKLPLEIKTANLSWSNLSLQNSAEREIFFKQEKEKAGKRVKHAFKDLQRQGILDTEGKLLRTGLPEDMEPGSGCDVGG